MPNVHGGPCVHNGSFPDDEPGDPWGTGDAPARPQGTGGEAAQQSSSGSGTAAQAAQQHSGQLLPNCDMHVHALRVKGMNAKSWGSVPPPPTQSPDELLIRKPPAAGATKAPPTGPNVVWPAKAQAKARPKGQYMDWTDEELQAGQRWVVPAQVQVAVVAALGCLAAPQVPVAQLPPVPVAQLVEPSAAPAAAVPATAAVPAAAPAVQRQSTDDRDLVRARSTHTTETVRLLGLADSFEHKGKRTKKKPNCDKLTLCRTILGTLHEDVRNPLPSSDARLINSGAWHENSLHAAPDEVVDPRDEAWGRNSWSATDDAWTEDKWWLPTPPYVYDPAFEVGSDSDIPLPEEDPYDRTHPRSFYPDRRGKHDPIDWNPTGKGAKGAKGEKGATGGKGATGEKGAWCKGSAPKGSNPRGGFERAKNKHGESEEQWQRRGWNDDSKNWGERPPEWGGKLERVGPPTGANCPQTLETAGERNARLLSSAMSVIAHNAVHCPWMPAGPTMQMSPLATPRCVSVPSAGPSAANSQVNSPRNSVASNTSVRSTISLQNFIPENAQHAAEVFDAVLAAAKENLQVNSPSHSVAAAGEDPSGATGASCMQCGPNDCQDDVLRAAGHPFFLTGEQEALLHGAKESDVGRWRVLQGGVRAEYPPAPEPVVESGGGVMAMMTELEKQEIIETVLSPLLAEYPPAPEPAKWKNLFNWFTK